MQVFFDELPLLYKINDKTVIFLQWWMSIHFFIVSWEFVLQNRILVVVKSTNIHLPAF